MMDENRLYEAFQVIDDIFNDWQRDKISAEKAYDQLISEVEELSEVVEDY